MQIDTKTRARSPPQISMKYGDLSIQTDLVGQYIDFLPAGGIDTGTH